MLTLSKFTNLIDLLKCFKDEQTCRDYLEQIRWSGKLTCPYADCGSDHCCKYSDGMTYKCSKCNRQYSVRVGTIFQDSRIPLQKWFAAIYLISAHKKGISSHQLGRDIGVTQKSAWFMLHRYRHSLKLGFSSEKLSGIVEGDETYIGGAEKNKHQHKKTDGTQGRSTKTKTPVIGVVQRGGEIRTEKAEDTKKVTLQPFIIKNVAFNSKFYTDEHEGYNGLKGIFKHKNIDHSADQYVDGEVHCNTMEGYFSLLKRGIIGIYHSVSNKHLQNYLDEFSFRYNTRTISGSNRFDLMLNNINTHLSYKELIAKHDQHNETPRDNRQMEGEQGTFGF